MIRYPDTRYQSAERVTLFVAHSLQGQFPRLPIIVIRKYKEKQPHVSPITRRCRRKEEEMWCAVSLSFLAASLWLGAGGLVDASIPSKAWHGWPRYVICGGQYFDSIFLKTLTRNASDTGNVEGRTRFWTTSTAIPFPALEERAIITIFLSFFEEVTTLKWDRALYTVYLGDDTIISPPHVCPVLDIENLIWN